MIAKSRQPDNYLTHSRGIASWIFTLDHKRIGVMYLLSVLVAFFLGGMFAMLIRTQLLEPDGLLFHKTDVLDGPAVVYKPYNQIFTRPRRGHDLPRADPRHPRRPWGTSSCRSCWGPRTSPSRG